MPKSVAQLVFFQFQLTTGHGKMISLVCLGMSVEISPGLCVIRTTDTATLYTHFKRNKS